MSASPRTDKFTANLIQHVTSLTRTLHRDGMHEVIDANLKTHGVFPAESKADYKYLRESAQIWGAEKVRGYKDSFGRYERIVITFAIGN